MALPPKTSLLPELAKKVQEELNAIAKAVAEGGEPRAQVVGEISVALHDPKERMAPMRLSQIVNCAAPITTRISEHNILLVCQSSSVFAKAAEQNEKLYLTFYCYIDGPLKDLLTFVFKKCCPEISILLESSFSRPSEI